jgi:hypothetical protein
MSEAQMMEQHHEIERERVQAAGETKKGRSKGTNQKRPREEEATSANLKSKGLYLLVGLLLTHFRVHALRYSQDRLRRARKERSEAENFSMPELLREKKKEQSNGTGSAAPENTRQGSKAAERADPTA